MEDINYNILDNNNLKLIKIKEIIYPICYKACLNKCNL